MFNEDLKNKFLQECVEKESQRYRIVRLFAVSEKYESLLNKDLCQMSQAELINPLEAIMGARLSTQTTDLSALRRYAKWCLSNNIPGACDGLMNVQSPGNKKLAGLLVSSPEHLQDRMNTVFAQEVDGKSDNLARGYLWLAYIGLTESQAVMIESSHMNFVTQTLTYDGEEYHVYKEAIPVLRALCVANSFYYEYNTHDVIDARSPGKKILRGTGSSPDPNTDSIRRIVTKRVSQAKTSDEEKFVLRFNSVRLSGVFSRMLEEELEEGYVNYEKALFEYDRNSNELDSIRRNRKILELKTDYQNWKTIFDK